MTDTATDNSIECRKSAEAGIAKAGHCSPRGSIHPCAACGTKIRWEDIVYVPKFINGMIRNIPRCPCCHA